MKRIKRIIVRKRVRGRRVTAFVAIICAICGKESIISQRSMDVSDNDIDAKIAENLAYLGYGTWVDCPKCKGKTGAYADGRS